MFQNLLKKSKKIMIIIVDNIHIQDKQSTKAYLNISQLFTEVEVNCFSIYHTSWKNSVKIYVICDN